MSQRQYVGGGWHIHHLTDRVIELRKESVAYRQISGRDGFVLLRVEPGTPRTDMIEQAIIAARKTDDELALRIAKNMIPTKQSIAEYQNHQRTMAKTFATPEDEFYIGRKRA